MCATRSTDWTRILVLNKGIGWNSRTGAVPEPRTKVRAEDGCLAVMAEDVSFLRKQVTGGAAAGKARDTRWQDELPERFSQKTY